jgi:hypothetical protein
VKPCVKDAQQRSDDHLVEIVRNLLVYQEAIDPLSRLVVGERRPFHQRQREPGGCSGSAS